MKTNPNESAFARPAFQAEIGTHDESDGLTKREYFAVTILQGMLASGINYLDQSRDAVHFADHLIDALNEGGSK